MINTVSKINLSKIGIEYLYIIVSDLKYKNHLLCSSSSPRTSSSSSSHPTTTRNVSTM